MNRWKIKTKLIDADHLVRSFLCFLLLFLSLTSVKALDRERAINQFHHTAWTAKDGAPSQIGALAQTADGYLWIGSALGLFRFDGVEFEQYEPPAEMQLPSHNIYALAAMPDGGLWISFRPSGLGYLKDGQLKIFSRPEELPKSQVYCFAQTPDGRVWAGTQQGLASFNGTGWDEIGAEWNFQPNRVRTMFTGRDGTLWVSKDDSIAVLPPGAQSFQTHLKQPDEYALQFAEAKDGRLWAASFVRSVGPVEAPASEKNPQIKVQSNGLVFDREGGLWLAAFPNGVKRLRFPEQLGSGTVEANDPRIETFSKSDGLSGDLVTNILEDREGNIWAGSDKGLDRFRYSSIAPAALPDQLQRLTMAAAGGGEIWSGSAKNAILHFFGGQIESIPLVPRGAWISSFYQADTGDIWWGAHGGLLHQTGKAFRFYPQPKNSVEDYLWEVFPGAGDGGLWVNFGDLGLLYFKDGDWEQRPSPAGLPERGPSASFEDEQKRIWLGYTENRVFVLSDNLVQQGYTSADGIEIGRIKVIRGRGGNFWFGGELGLAFFKNGRFYTVRTDGKPFGAVSGIITTENGDLWLNEAGGIVDISADELRQLGDDPGHPVKYRVYDFEDNLPGGPQMNFTVSTAVETTDRRLWFATDNGVAVIDPPHLEKNNVPPPVIIKSALADEKLYTAAPGITFPAGTTNLQINYTATSLSIPERVRFKYRLAGFDNQWREAGTRRAAFYTNLAPGKYRFQVIAANNDGVWNEEGADLEFEIRPMFYQTSWFLLVCLAAAATLIWAGYRLRLYQVKSHLDLLYEERLSERTRIAQDLHDTLLQGIVSVSMHLETALNKLPAESPAKSRLERMREMIRQIISEGRNTVNGLRSSRKLDAHDLEQELSLISQQLNARGQTSFRITSAGPKRALCPPIHEEIYHICREALANAFRHSEAASIEVEMEYAKTFFKIVIRDDGLGIDELVLESGRAGHWGLSGMKTRAEKIGAKLKVYSRPGAGTEIELTVPGRVAFEIEKTARRGTRLHRFFQRKNSARASGEKDSDEKQADN